MKIVIATDSFKGTLKAYEACEIIAKAIAEITPDAQLVIKPMADGGEGTARAMIKAANGRWIPQTVMGPLPDMQVEAGFAWFDDKTALVEMASASGLRQRLPRQRKRTRISCMSQAPQPLSGSLSVVRRSTHDNDPDEDQVLSTSRTRSPTLIGPAAGRPVICARSTLSFSSPWPAMLTATIS